jgi:predicted ATP-grasp superfamily ATP-dependent carboligase
MRTVRHKTDGPPFLLTMPSYGGTLAAVRCLGRHGIDVTMAGGDALAAARWSRYATRWTPCPPVSHSAELLAWLFAFAEREPKHVLYASSDDIAYLYAVNAEALAKRYYMYQPPLRSLVRVLDKKLLVEACHEVGLDTVPSWFPSSAAELPALARAMRFPVLIKARTQVLRARQTKGVVVERPDELAAGYEAFLADHRYLPGLSPHFDADVQRPMIQRYFAKGAESVYSISGFLDRSGELVAARAAVKVFQRTRPVGLGVCFETAPIDEKVLAGILRLCKAVGHFGVFEVEVVRDEGRSMVIDFNPRFYGQMGFDTARGIPLAYLTWLGATGNERALQGELARAARAGSADATIYTHRFIFELLLLAQRLGGSLSSDERDRWKRWYADHRGTSVDASADRRDPLPGLVHAASELWPGVRALRRVLRERTPSEIASAADNVPPAARSEGEEDAAAREERMHS